MITSKLREYDDLFTPFFDWLAGQYDPKTGGFYHARSSFDLPGNHPDIESTTFATNILRNFHLIEALPDAVRRNIILFFQSLQDPQSGYFYDRHPAMRRDEVMLARAQGFTLKGLGNLGGKPLYPLPEPKGLPDSMTTPESMVKWMSEVELTNAWRGCDKMSSVRMYITLMDDTTQKRYWRAAWDYLEQTQDPETGFWGKGRPLIRLSGTFKILAGFYREHLDLVPNKPKMFRGVLQAIRTDEYLDFCWVRNPVDILTMIQVQPTPDELEEIIVRTVDGVKSLHRPDGGFSRERDHSPPATNVAQVKPGDGHRDIPEPVILSRGLYESDLNASTQADSVRRMLYKMAGLPATAIDTTHARRLLSLL